MFETCVEIRSHFSDYLDDRCAPEARKSIRYHLSNCDVCQEQLEQWQSIREELQALPHRQIPPELALRLRVRLSQQLHANFIASLWVRFENAIRPLLIPATGGVISAVICFCLIMGSGVAPITDIPDVSVQLVTPARVQVLAPMDFNTGENGLVLVTQINAEGRVKGYRVLSGERSPELMQRLDRMIYFSVFQPATMFGRPTDGEVVLSLRRITVRG
ncbi:MAG: zf-HC2 domain-containing protein [Terriglobia bacterium]